MTGKRNTYSQPTTWEPEEVASGCRPQNDAERAARKAYCTAHGLYYWCNSDKHQTAPLIAIQYYGIREQRSLQPKSPRDTSLVLIRENVKLK